MRSAGWKCAQRELNWPAYTDNTLSRSGCTVSNDLSAFAAAHGSQSCATVPASLMAAFLTVSPWLVEQKQLQTRGDVHMPQKVTVQAVQQRITLQSVNGFEDRVFEAKAKAKAGPTRGQGHDHRILSSSCLRVRGQSSRTPSHKIIKKKLHAHWPPSMLFACRVRNSSLRIRVYRKIEFFIFLWKDKNKETVHVLFDLSPHAFRMQR